ncbi:MAG: hypothetical protein D6718_10085 [Acidobacteria bacterium]|nr:MAG: hypothetical protein D6718_10085 [Acidobacteriota bacterium]
MKIRGWSISGYGGLRDLVVENLPDGLTVVHGPNEAGKSTLLRFLREMLFAPWSGRGSSLGMAPLGGGAHGGRLWLEADGVRYTLDKRVQGRRTVCRLTDAEGRELDESVLRALLGGVDRGVFEGVFSFDHAELAELGRLTRSRVREEIFSATITGAGRSARAALEALERRASEILRPRSGGQLNALLERSQALHERFEEARLAAARHRELIAEEERLAGRLEELKQRQKELRREQWWLSRLVEVRAALDRIADLRAERDAIEIDPGLRRMADETGALAAEISRVEDLERRLDELEVQISGCEQELVVRSAALGPGFDEARLSALSESSPMATELARRERELEERRAALRAAEENAAGAAAAIADARAERDERRAVVEALGSDSASLDDLLARRRLLDALAEARVQLAAAERAAEDRAARLHEARLRTSEAVRRARLTGLAGPLWAAAAAVVAAAAWVGSRMPAAALLLAAAGAAIAGLAWRLRRLSRESAEDIAAREAELAAAAEQAEGDCEQLREEVGAMCRELGVDPAAGARDLARIRAACDAEIERAAAASRAADALREAERAFRRAEERGKEALLAVESARKALEQVEADWREWAARQGLPEGIEPAQARALFGEAAKVAELTKRRAELHRERDLAERRIETWKERALALARSAGKLQGAGEPPLGVIAAAVRELQARIQENDLSAERAKSLDRSLSRAEEELDELLAGVEEAERLREEARRGHPEEWRRRLQALENELAEAEAALEQPRETLARVRGERERIEGSALLAELELELDALRGEARRLLREWRIAQTARRLVADALEEYQRSHQPEVLAAASGAFRSMTAGRYEKVVQAGETFAVLDARGGRLDPEHLSQGTVEQLYLAVRFGLARYLSRRGMRIPFVMDDVLVNFDPERRRAAAHLIGELAADRQIFFFSCHPSVVEALRREAGRPRIVELPPVPIP